MKFTLETARGIQIHGYQPGELTLRLPAKEAGQASQLVSYHSSLIIANEAGPLDWAVRHINKLASHHFEFVWQNRPEIVLLGSGQRMAFPPQAIREEFALKGIGFEAMDTRAACRTYNVLLAEGRDVTALLIID